MKTFINPNLSPSVVSLLESDRLVSQVKELNYFARSAEARSVVLELIADNFGDREFTLNDIMNFHLELYRNNTELYIWNFEKILLSMVSFGDLIATKHYSVAVTTSKLSYYTDKTETHHKTETLYRVNQNRLKS